MVKILMTHNLRANPLTPVFIVEHHHQVLSAWAQLRNQLDQAPRLLTLDHHTDTAAPFRSYLKQSGCLATPEQLIKDIQFSNTQSIQNAICHLAHDEHITTAIGANIIDAGFVIAHRARNTDLECYHQHRIACQEVTNWPRSHANYRQACDQVIESLFLQTKLQAFNALLSEAQEPPLGDTPYILDIDLDYFNTHKSTRPEDPRLLRELLAHAHLVTIATEPDFVQSCTLEKGLTSQDILPQILQLFHHQLIH